MCKHISAHFERKLLSIYIYPYPSNPNMLIKITCKHWSAAINTCHEHQRACSVYFRRDLYTCSQGLTSKMCLGVDTSSTAMGTRTTSLLKDLVHRNPCVGLAGNNLEPHMQWEARNAGNCNTLLDLADKSRRVNRHNMSVLHVLV